ncbi:hypothetical protein CALCODRAFT_492619 [Calocera cornea HHB12733]|uniref:F-box domain-containing protein n=1 Tax=Calocera cornea HHB12733 TaxID=1353952 RepID=A0A165I9J7_9BASI|nr:hypothetical protein CALCODRAFT_492619 [Calocera cornea HHB12733]
MVHHVFEIPELVLAILNFLPDKADQKRFLLLCRPTWNIIAGERWKEVKDPWRLNALLPSDVKLLGPGPNETKGLKSARLSRALRKREWDGIGMYTQHIQRLLLHDGKMGLDRERKPILVSGPLWILSTYRGVQPLFPALRAVTLHMEWPSTYVVCRLLLSQELESVSLSISTALQKRDSSMIWLLVDPLLDLLVEHGARLETLVIDCGRAGRSVVFNAQFADRLYRLMGGLKRAAVGLRNVSFAPLSADAPVLLTLAGIDGLQSIALRLNTGDMAAIDRIPEDSFQDLLRVEIVTDWLHTLHTIFFLSKISSESLEAIVMEASTTGEELANFNNVVATRWCKSLVHFAVGCAPFQGEIPLMARHLPLQWPDMEPLLQCLQLQTLKISLQYPADLTDERVAIVVGSLPSLRVLHLGSLSTWPSSKYIPHTTVHSLENIASGLVRLVDLMLDVNLGTMSIRNRDLEAAANPRIRSFVSRVLGGPVSKEVVRGRINKLFPSLVDIILTDNTEGMAESFSGRARESYGMDMDNGKW